MNDEPRLLKGGLAVDDRGQVSFVNDFDFAGVKRFYSVTNHRERFVRAWHAHRKEGKYVLVATGSAIVGAVKIDDWENPSPALKPHRYVLSAVNPQVLWVPPGFANGFMNLSAETTLLFFSTSTLEESKGDDYRYDARRWDIWQVEER